MLAFLIGTSILNIFLGYALAVYLMRESLTLENHRHSANQSKPTEPSVGMGTVREQAEQSTGDVSLASPTEALTESAQIGNGSSTDSDPPTSRSAGEGTVATDEASERHPEELDQQLLAGIADFRSQLAKLRSESGTEEPKRRPVARTTPK